MTRDMPAVATLVVGAGVSGLAAAIEAFQFGDVAVLESSGRVGGVLRSGRDPEGWLTESAAASFLLPAPATSSTLATIGTPPSLAAASDAAKRRWLFVDDRLEPIPASAPELLRTRLVSPWAKLGVLCEPFAGRAADGEESVSDFVARRLGGEIARTFAQPIVSGITGGDAHNVSVDAAFPLLKELEAQGGILRAGLRRMRASRAAGVPRGRLHSFVDGMESLAQEIAGWLTAAGAVLRTDAAVSGIEPAGDSGKGRWRVTCPDGVIETQRLLLACTPETVADLLDPLAPDAASATRAIPRSPIAIVAVGLEADVLADHVGFGFLAHPSSSLEILGATFDSHLYPRRAPEGMGLARVMLGGALRPALVAADDAALLDIAVRDLGRALGRTIVPVWSHVVRQERGIPQYHLGHRARVSIVENELDTLGGVDVAGWAWRGVGVNACIADGVARVRLLHERGETAMLHVSAGKGALTLE